MPICIAGMHRSGTSMITKILHMNGLYLGPEQKLMPPKEDNPEGFWEHLDFVAVNEKILFAHGGGWDFVPSLPDQWYKNKSLKSVQSVANQIIQTFKGYEPWGWKDPRNTITFPFWKELLPDVKLLAVIRNPIDVARSLNKRNGFSLAAGLQLWYDYNVQFLSYEKNSEIFYTFYEEFFNNVESALVPLIQFCNLKSSNAEIQNAIKAVNSQLRHFTTDTRELESFPQFSHIIQLYKELLHKKDVSYKRFQKKTLHAVSKNLKNNADSIKPKKKSTKDVSKGRLKSKRNHYDLSIIIPVFNGKEYTHNCIESILQNTEKSVSFEIIVVDDGSTDGTDELMEQFVQSYSNISYVQNEKNSGFGTSCNNGAKIAKGDFLLFLNNDTVVEPGWATPMLQLFNQYDKVGIVGPKLLYPDRTIQHAGIELSKRVVHGEEVFWPYHIYRHLPEKNENVVHSREVFAVTGAALLIKKSIFEKVDGFSREYYMYFEDIDLNVKVRDLGYNVWYCADSTIIHYEGKSSKDQQKIDELNVQSFSIFWKKWKSWIEQYKNNKYEVKYPVIWSAPFFNPSGYASEAINYALGLDNRIDLTIEHDSSLFSKEFMMNLPSYWKETLHHLYRKIDENKKYIFISHQPGHGLKPKYHLGYVIGRTMFETDRVPEFWVPIINQMNEVWVPSRFNYETFRKSGIVEEKLQIIPESIDTTLFDPDQVEPLDLPDKAAFNFLSIFEWTNRKGWDILLKAYFETFTNEDDVCLYLRTFILGDYEGTMKDAIQQKIQRFVEENHYNPEKLPRIELITEQLPLKDLIRLYKAVDAFVLPSRGEGWGRPYMEAMSMGLPVIGTNWSGNTEFMNHNNSYLINIKGLVEIEDNEIPFYIGHKWAQPDVKHLKEIMRKIVRHPDKAKKIGERAREYIKEHYNINVVANQIIERLKEIEKSIRRKNFVVFNKPKTLLPSIRWEGSFFVYHSLALVNREINVRLLEKGCDLSLIPRGLETFLPEKNSSYYEMLKRINVPLPEVDVHVRHFWPPDLTPPEEGHWVIIQPWEFGSLPKIWVDIFSTIVDELWVPSTYVKKVYVDSGIPEDRVFVVPNGINPKKFNENVPPFPLKTKKKFKFLFVGGTIYRKGIDILLNAYKKAFTREDDVCLVIKDMGGKSFYKGQTYEEEIKKFMADPDNPEIEYIDYLLSEEELIGLYTACDVLVHPYRGEGFGLPILESMACGKTVIVTNGGACLDFCNEENALLVKARTIKLDKKAIGNKETVDYPWLYEVDEQDLIEKMTFAYQNPEKLKILAKNAYKTAHEQFTWEQTANSVLERAKELAKLPIRRNKKEALEDLFSRIENHIESGELELAEQLIQAVEKRISHTKLLLLKARLYLAQNKLSEVVDIAQELSKRSPDDYNYYYILGRIFLQKEQLDDARNAFAQSIRLKNDFVEAQYYYGKTFLEADDVDAALQVFEAILKNHPDHDFSKIEMIKIYLYQGEFLKALELFSKVKDASSIEETVLEKCIEFMQGNEIKEHVEHAFKVFSQMDIPNTHFYNELGVIAWNFGYEDYAIQLLERALNKDGNNFTAALNLIDIHLQKGNFDLAIPMLYMYVKKHPEDVENVLKLSHLLVEGGKIEEAREILEDAMLKSPDDQIRHFHSLLDFPKKYMVYAFLQQNELELANKNITELLSENPEDVELKLLQASIEFTKNNIDEAEKIYFDVYSNDPLNVEAVYYLAQISYIKGGFEKFIEFIESISFEWEKQPDLLKLYIQVLLDIEDFDQAVQKLDYFISLFPEDYYPYFVLGKLYQEIGETEKALQFYNVAMQKKIDNPQVIEEINQFVQNLEMENIR